MKAVDIDDIEDDDDDVDGEREWSVPEGEGRRLCMHRPGGRKEHSR